MLTKQHHKDTIKKWNWITKNWDYEKLNNVEILLNKYPELNKYPFICPYCDVFNCTNCPLEKINQACRIDGTWWSKWYHSNNGKQNAKHLLNFFIKEYKKFLTRAL